MKHLYPRKKIFIVTSIRKMLHMQMEIKNLREYYDVYVQRETSLLADVFENF